MGHGSWGGNKFIGLEGATGFQCAADIRVGAGCVVVVQFGSRCKLVRMRASWNEDVVSLHPLSLGFYFSLSSSNGCLGGVVGATLIKRQQIQPALSKAGLLLFAVASKLGAF